MERGFTLFCNILILIVTIIVTIIVLIVNFWFFPMIRQAINLVYDKYTPIAATINVPITTKSVQDTLREVTDGQVKIEPFVKELEKELDAATGPTGDIDISKLLAGPPENDMHHGVGITKRAKTTTNTPSANNIPNEIAMEEIERERERERARRDVVSNKNNSTPTTVSVPVPVPEPPTPPPEPVPTPVPEPSPPTK
jgi:hypothetical protein